MNKVCKKHPRISSLPFLCLMGCLVLGNGMALEAQASLDGHALAALSGEPVPNAQVLLRSSSATQVLRAESDSSGAFRFPAVAPGNYHLEIGASGYLTAHYDLLLKPRQVLSMEIELFAQELENPEYMEVRASYADLDPGQTGSSRTLTRDSLDRIPVPLRSDLPTLAQNLLPGALVGHDNFVHVRGNELSLHQFINGVSFLDNSHQHFTAGISPQIFESANFITGGFPAEFGNRFGGVVDITTRSGQARSPHGSVTLGAGTALNHDVAVDYGGSSGRWGYYFFTSGFESGDFLNPPTERAIHDLGYGSQGTLQIDYQGDNDLFKFLVIGGGTNFQLPNTVEESEAGRDALRRVRSQTAIFTWQHVFSGLTSLSTSLYQRNVSDRLLGTTDPVTAFGEGSRSTLTVGAKTDLTLARFGHTFKVGLDVSTLRLRESFSFDPREHEEAAEENGHGVQALRQGPPDPRFPLSSAGPLEPISFRGRDLGGQVSLYFQDRFSPFRNFTLDAGLRWDQVNLVGSEHQVSPRLALAYHVPHTHSVLHFAYNRFFTPPPVEYVILASYLGNQAVQEEREEGHEDASGGNVRAYTQDYYEVGWSQQVHPRFIVELNAYHHRGENAFETAEISNTRLFLPINFGRGRASGAELSLILRQLERLGLEGRFQYGASRVHFFGPVSGGFPGEELEPGERILPAFDQTHTATASLFYRNPWRRFWAGFNLRYGSGTPVEEVVELNGVELERVVRLPEHLTADFSAGVGLWEKDSQRMDLEFNLSNLSNNIYRIGKESEATPIQFAPRRIARLRLAWRF